MRLRSMPQKRAHDVHLRVARRGISAAAVDLFENDGSFRDAKTSAAVFLGNQRSHIPRTRQRLDEGLGVGAFFVEIAPIDVWEFAAQFKYRGFQFFVRFIHRAVHWTQRKTSS